MTDRFVDINAEEFNIFQQYSKEEIDNFKCIFDMFDHDKKDVVGVKDLQTIMQSLGRDPQEAIDIVEELNFDPYGSINFEDFLRIMKSLENRLGGNVDGGVAAPGDEQEGNDPPNLIDGQNYEQNMLSQNNDMAERTKYGCLLPRTGVHFLPDSKVVDFLRLLNEYRQKCCKEMNLTEARRAALKFEDLRNKEMLR